MLMLIVYMCACMGMGFERATYDNFVLVFSLWQFVCVGWNSDPLCRRSAANCVMLVQSVWAHRWRRCQVSGAGDPETLGCFRVNEQSSGEIPDLTCFWFEIVEERRIERLNLYLKGNVCLCFMCVNGATTYFYAHNLNVQYPFNIIIQGETKQSFVTTSMILVIIFPKFFQEMIC